MGGWRATGPVQLHNVSFAGHLGTPLLHKATDSASVMGALLEFHLYDGQRATFYFVGS
jgi:hypothetical protein